MSEKRQKQAVTFTLSPDVVERLKAWIAGHHLPPKQNAVVEMAITRFLDEESKPSNKARST